MLRELDCLHIRRPTETPSITVWLPAFGGRRPWPSDAAGRWVTNSAALVWLPRPRRRRRTSPIRDGPSALRSAAACA
ncbi:hypothetical protein NJ7G_2721 [Natrinema sp. J7-2]|nr:hypothetical protein NJ7G_2721 [Natrinema sp. J7-2]